MPDVTARAALAEEVFGGTSEKLAGIVNMTASEFAALEQQVADTADVVSTQDLAAAKELTQNMDDMKASIGGAFTSLGTAVIPILNTLFDSIKEAMPALKDTFLPIFEELKKIWADLQPTLASLGDTLMNDVLPALQDIWNAISPVLIPAIKLLVGIIGTNLKTAFDVIAGVLKVVAAVLTGDFAGAWRAIQETVLKVVRNMVGLVNKFLGLFGKEIDTSGLDQALADIEAEARDMAEGADAATESTEQLAEATGDTTRELALTGEALAKAEQAAKDAAVAAEKLAEAFDSASDALSDYSSEQRTATMEARLMAGATGDVEKAQLAQSLAAWDSRQAAIELRIAESALHDIMEDSTATADDVKEALERFTEAKAAAETASGTLEAAEYDLADAIRDVEDAAISAEQALADYEAEQLRSVGMTKLMAGAETDVEKAIIHHTIASGEAYRATVDLRIAEAALRAVLEDSSATAEEITEAEEAFTKAKEDAEIASDNLAEAEINLADAHQAVADAAAKADKAEQDAADKAEKDAADAAQRAADAATCCGSGSRRCTQPNVRRRKRQTNARGHWRLSSPWKPTTPVRSRILPQPTVKNWRISNGITPARLRHPPAGVGRHCSGRSRPCGESRGHKPEPHPQVAGYPGRLCR